MPLHVSSTVVLIIRRSKLYYTASGIITPVGGRPVHRLREDSHPDNDNNVDKDFPHKWRLQRVSSLWGFICANVWVVILVPSNKGLLPPQPPPRPSDATVSQFMST